MKVVLATGRRTGNHHYCESDSKGQRIMQQGKCIEREESNVQKMRHRLTEILDGWGGRIWRKDNNITVSLSGISGLEE